MMSIFERYPQYPNPFDPKLEIFYKKNHLNYNVASSFHRKTSSWQITNIHFCKELVTIKKKDIASTHFYSLFQKHFHEHRRSVPIFTDGSKSKLGVGLAVVMRDFYVSCRLPNEVSIFYAELYAILIALKLIMTIDERSFVIVSDSRSALMALENCNNNNPLVSDIQEWYNLLRGTQKEIYFCWVPSHVGVSGNEIADKKAKLAIQKKAISNQLSSHSDPLVNKRIRMDWQTIWRNELYHIKPIVEKWTTSMNKMLTRIRIAHSYIMDGKPITCSNCNVQHILVECPLRIQQRRQTFRSVDNNLLTLKKLLEEYFYLKSLIAYKTLILNKI